VSSTNSLSTDMFKNMLRLEEKIKEKEGNNNDLAELISYYGVF
jgi:hypothetical protein